MFWYGFICAWIFFGLIITVDELFNLDNIQVYGGLGWLLILPFVPIIFIIGLIKTMSDSFYRMAFLKKIKKKFHKK